MMDTRKLRGSLHAFRVLCKTAYNLAVFLIERIAMFTELLVWWMNLFDKNDTKNFIQGLFWLFYGSGVEIARRMSRLDDSTVAFWFGLIDSSARAGSQEICSLELDQLQ